MNPDAPQPDHEAWSAAQEECEVRVDGHDLTMAYRDEGPEDAHPVIFLHGIPTWSFLWRRIAPAFEGEYRTIVPDMLGYGNSDRRDSFDRSIRAQEDALHELIDELELGVVSLVAHDIGGGVALRYAAHHPDRVETLVLSNAACYDAWPVPFINEMGLPGTARMDPVEFEGRLDFAFGDGLYGDDPDPEWVEGMKEPWLREDGRLALSRAAVSTNTNHTTEIDYDVIDSRTVCVWGADDRMVPIDYGERLAGDLDGEILPLSEAYHWVVEDRPVGYREALAEALA